MTSAEGDMRQTYQIRLADLGEQGAQMCDVAGDALRQATGALLSMDLYAADVVTARTEQLNRMRAGAEQTAIELLALHAPVASELRTVMSALWIVADAHRMGQLALHIAEAVHRRHPAKVVPNTVRPVVEQMSQIGVDLADSAARLVRGRDLALARQIELDDDLMDDRQRDLFAALLAPTWSHGVESAVDITLLGRFYERFADHAVAIARRVVFLVTGDQVGRPAPTA